MNIIEWLPSNGFGKKFLFSPLSIMTDRLKIAVEPSASILISNTFFITLDYSLQNIFFSFIDLLMWFLWVLHICSGFSICNICYVSSPFNPFSFPVFLLCYFFRSGIIWMLIVCRFVLFTVHSWIGCSRGTLFT